MGVITAIARRQTRTTIPTTVSALVALLPARRKISRHTSYQLDFHNPRNQATINDKHIVIPRILTDMRAMTLTTTCILRTNTSTTTRMRRTRITMRIMTTLTTRRALRIMTTLLIIAIRMRTIIIGTRLVPSAGFPPKSEVCRPRASTSENLTCLSFPRNYACSNNRVARLIIIMMIIILIMATKIVMC